MQLSGVVEEHISLIPVLNRFGVRLGLGDKTVKEVCDEYEIDSDFLLVLLNTFLNEEYFPEKKLQTFHTSQIIDYLTKTNLDFQRHQVPNVERHFSPLISMGEASNNNSLNLIGKFFASFKTKLTDRIEKDTTEWFPYCLGLSEKLEKKQNGTKGSFVLNLPEEQIDNSLEALLTDLKSLMIKHISGEYNDNLCYAVLFSISSLEKDIRQQDRIRFRILAPMVSAMEKLSR